MPAAHDSLWLTDGQYATVPSDNIVPVVQVIQSLVYVPQQVSRGPYRTEKRVVVVVPSVLFVTITRILVHYR